MEAVTFDGTLDALSPIREYVKEAAAAAGLDDSATYNLTLAVDEIATNVIVHGYEEAGLSGNISIGATVLDDRLIVQLSDHGKSYDPNFHREPDDEGLSKELSERPVGGLGIMLAKDSVDDLEYESTAESNVHRFVVRLKPPEHVSDEHRKLEILLSISKSLGQEIQLDPLLKLIVSEVTDAMQAERSTLFLLDHRKPDELVSRVAEGMKSQEIRIRMGFGIAGTTAQSRQPINIPDAYKDPRFNPAFDKSSGFRTRSILTNAIVDQQEHLIGVVQVLNKKGGSFTREDEQFLAAICVHLAIALQRAEMVEAYLQSQLVNKSLELAREIQMGLIPKNFEAVPDKTQLDIYATMIPALEVGGDLYDFFPLDEDRLCFIIGDVSDKGVPAALFMAMARTAFKMSAIESRESIAHTMSQVNQFLIESNPEGMFVTAFAGILDLRTGRVEYADAGHEPPFVLKRSGQVVKVRKEGGIVLGVLPGYEYGSEFLQLEPGDALVLYTDGVTEAMNLNHDLFGAEAIEKSLSGLQSGARSEIVMKSLLADVHAFVGAAHQSDDITALVIQYLAGADAHLDHQIQSAN